MFVKIKSVGEEGCTAVLFGSVLVMAVHAPDCCKDLDVHETFVKEKPNQSVMGKTQEPRGSTSRVTWGCCAQAMMT